MSSLSRIIINSGLYTIVNAIEKAGGLILLPIYTHYMSPGDYGIVANVTAFLFIFQATVGLGLHRAAGRFFFDARDNPERVAQIWGTILIILSTSVVFFSALILVCISVWGHLYFHDIPLSYVYAGFGIVIGTPFQAVYTTILRIQEKGRTFSIYKITIFLINIVFNLSFLIILEWGAWGVLAANAISMLVAGMVAIAMMRRQVAWSIDRPLLRPLFLYSLPLLPHALAGALMAGLGKMLLPVLDSASATGLFAVGMSVSSVLKMLTSSVKEAVRPKAYERLMHFDETARDELYNISLLMVAFFSIIATIGSLGSHEFIILFTSKSYLDVWKIVPILLTGTLLHGIYFTISFSIHYEKSASRYLIYLSLIALIVGSIANIILIPMAGVMGAALSTVLSSGVYVLVGTRVAHQHHPMRWPIGKFTLMAAIVALASGVTYVLHSSELSVLAMLTIKLCVALITIGLIALIASPALKMMFDERGLKRR